MDRAGTGCPVPGFVALDDGILVGVLLGGETPAVEPGESYVFPHLLVARSRRRRGIARRLVGALAVEPRSAPTAWVVATPRKADVEATMFLRATGFEPRDEAVLYERDTAPRAGPRPGTPTPSTYDGDDDARNDVIADLFRRSFRGRFGTPDLGSAGVRQWCAVLTALVLEDRGKPVGCGFVRAVAPEASVAAVLVARSHWGGPVADVLMDAMTALARERGCERIVGAVHRTNHASHRMVARHGWREFERVPYLARRIGVLPCGAAAQPARPKEGPWLP